MNEPDPIPPKPSSAAKSLLPSLSDKASFLAGTPLGVLGVMFYQDYVGHPVDAVYAVAIGSTFATVVGYAWHVATVLINRAIER